MTLEQDRLQARDTLLAALAQAGYDNTLAEAEFDHDEAVADAERAWVDSVWSTWDAATQLRLTQESDAAEAVQIAQRDLQMAVASSQVQLAQDVATLSYSLEQRARDQMAAQQAHQQARDQAHLDRRIASLQQEYTHYQNATAEQLRYVSLANPRGTPPPPRPQRPSSSDGNRIVVPLLFSLANRPFGTIRYIYPPFGVLSHAYVAFLPLHRLCHSRRPCRCPARLLASAGCGADVSQGRSEACG